MARHIIGAGVMLWIACGAATAQTPPAQTVQPTSRTFALALRFERNSLQGALELVSPEIGVPIEIVAKDLQLNGISGCQSYGLDEPKQPVEDLLQKILVRFYPDGKLAYTVKPSPEGVETVYVGVREEIEKRGEPLFPEFKLRPPRSH